MRILLDHCLPRRLKSEFINHQTATAAEMGWDTLRNGRLLAAAGTQFDVFLTIDKNLKHQQNLSKLPIAVVVILAPTNRFEDVVLFVPAVEQVLSGLQTLSLVEVSLVP